MTSPALEGCLLLLPHVPSVGNNRYPAADQAAYFAHLLSGWHATTATWLQHKADMGCWRELLFGYSHHARTVLTPGGSVAQETADMLADGSF